MTSYFCFCHLVRVFFSPEKDPDIFCAGFTLRHGDDIMAKRCQNEVKYG